MRIMLRGPPHAESRRVLQRRPVRPPDDLSAESATVRPRQPAGETRQPNTAPRRRKSASIHSFSILLNQVLESIYPDSRRLQPQPEEKRFDFREKPRLPSDFTGRNSLEKQNWRIFFKIFRKCVCIPADAGYSEKCGSPGRPGSGKIINKQGGPCKWLLESCWSMWNAP